jgi:phosphotransferase system  glucose/maltose/N-acetylglucosamine-specific IIC component
MSKYDLKAWAKSKSKKYWVLTGIIVGFVILGIVAAIVAMYACGYTLITWFKKFGWIFLIVVSIVAVLVCGILLLKARKE